MSLDFKVPKQLAVLFVVVLVLYCPCFSINSFLKVAHIKNPSPGHIFLSDAIVDNVIFNNYGRAIDSVALSSVTPGLDFRIQRNGAMTYADTKKNKFYQLNSNYKIIDSFQVTNGWETDFHEFIITENGSYYLIANQLLTVDLSEKVPNGNKEALVIEQIIQKFNKNKELIWSFSMFDNLDMLEGSEEVDYTQKLVDPYHINSIDEDQYGNIYISVRNFSQIMKINLETSKIVWRLGGSKSKNNDFKFLNDEIDGYVGNSITHDAKLLPNGNLLFIDNGNLRPEKFTRAVEYKINESAKTVEKVWEYIPNPKTFSSIMCSAQRLENGNTFIAIGNDLFEVTKDNDVVFRAAKLFGSAIYRSYKFPYKLNTVHLNVAAAGIYDFNKNGNNTYAQMSLLNLSSKGYINLTRHDYKPQRYSFNELEPSRIINQRWVIESDIDYMGKISINANNFPDYNKKDSLVAFARDNEDLGDFKRIVTEFNRATGIITLEINRDCEFIITSSEQIINSRPSLQVPRNNEITSKDITFKWSPVQYAEEYEFELSDQIDFKKIIASSTNLKTTNITVPNLINGRSYLWRVRAKSGASISQWSDVWNLKVIIATPNLVYPLQSAKGVMMNEVLRWSQISQSSYYDIQVAKDSAFTQLAMDVKGYLDSSLALSKLENRTNYYWRVRAGNLESVTNWSSVRSFRTELQLPNITYPEKNQNAVPTNFDVEFVKSKEADYYQLLIAEDDNFYNARSLNFSSNQAMALTQLENYKNYVIKARAIAGVDTSRWSDIVSFKTVIAKPELKFPLRFMMLVPVPTLFILSEVKDATGYELNIVSTLNEKLLNEEVILDTTFISSNFNFMVTFLEKKTTNKWRARTVYQYGKSDWTNFSEFSLGTAGVINPPMLSSPLNNSNSESLNGFLTWNNTANDINSYRVILAEDENFEKILIDDIVSDKKIYYKNLYNNKNYYWKVASVKDGEFSEWAPIWKFTTKKADVISAPKLILPENNVEVKSFTVDFIWEKLATANSYDLQIAKDIDFNLITKEEKSLPGYNYNFNKPTPNTQYFWRVRATQKDSTNAGLWSEVYSFKMAKELTSIAEEDESIAQISDFIIGKDYLLRDIKGALVNLAENHFKDINELKINLASGVYFLVPLQNKNKVIKLIK